LLDWVTKSIGYYKILKILKFPEQCVKSVELCVAGAPVSMEVSPEEDQVIENGSIVVFTVDLMDKSGNPTTMSKASVTCTVRYCVCLIDNYAVSTNFSSLTIMQLILISAFVPELLYIRLRSQGRTVGDLCNRLFASSMSFLTPNIINIIKALNENGEYAEVNLYCSDLYYPKSSYTYFLFYRE